MKREPRLLDGGERNLTLRSRRWLDSDDLGPCWSLHRNDFSLDAAPVLRTEHVRPPSNKSTPLVRGAKWPLTWRRHLQHVLRRHQPTVVETSFDGSRGTRAVVDRDGCTVPPINSKLDQRTISRPPSTELDEVILQHLELRPDNRFQRILHSLSRKSSREQKNVGSLPHISPAYQLRPRSINKVERAVPRGKGGERSMANERRPNGEWRPSIGRHSPSAAYCVHFYVRPTLLTLHGRPRITFP